MGQRVTQPDQEDDCRHCSPRHGDPNVVSWGVWVHSDRDGDGQPTMLVVAKSDGAHVAESDAVWLRGVLAEHDRRRVLNLTMGELLGP